MNDAHLEMDKADIIAALDYRSGPDSCNSVYLGSMAVGMICSAVGTRYGHHFDLRERIKNGSREQIDKALEACAGVIEYMKAHPTKKCPVCGKIGTTKREPVAYQSLTPRGWVTVGELGLETLREEGAQIRGLYVGDTE